LLTAMARAGRTVLMVTHERDVSAYVDRVITLADGRVAGQVAGTRRDASGGAHA
ncbi:MAG: ABC transporter ATP-binding protein, partial [Deltaproteobacteria bacterium]|nr:ABC transporter ATP-binding protein [Deltaproteobacteria bacterium]